MTAGLSTGARDEAIVRLRAAGCVFAEEEAAILGEAADGSDDALAAMVTRRAAGEPVEQVVGYADFGGVRVRLRPGVFVPRVRSELLVRLGAAAIGPGALVVDLCCGSGALGLAVRHRVPGITLHAADLDPVAVTCARENLTADSEAAAARVRTTRTAAIGAAGNQAEGNQAEGNQARVHQGDLFQALPTGLRGRIDLILANVPYVATRHIPFLPAEARDHEPRTALDGGDDGLAVFRAVAAEAPRWLAPGGLLLSEITEAQTATALTIADGNGLTATVVTDDDLDARAILSRRPR
ncbi:methyltransferase [Actinoplanes sp. NEAU-A12]|uniref:Methyltransferase n=1 Tax=Actinoplanes sandaracinus TaxID=3045177 RepID=A0ABT6WEX8_9ACTN|nr:methyltransferase [Actinoplanes sandaracinus]MDI6098272.1 methyltransferase [Actinoplanes sandaracinus]